jgi:hypothetical protein
LALLLGHAGALQRSELAGIAREHVTFTRKGLRLFPCRKSDVEAVQARLFRAVAPLAVADGAVFGPAEDLLH